MIELTLNRIAETKSSTAGTLWHDKKWLGWIIEDGHNEPKIPGKTRIPAGRYKIEKQTFGKFFEKYKRQFKHTFVPHLINVPGFEGILMHAGNNIDDTRGCLLPNRLLQVDENGNYSGQLSLACYDDLIEYLTPHDEIWITISDPK
jgi:hypothetical protein